MASNRTYQAPLAFKYFDDPSNVNIQQQSPLFATLVPEIREVIYQYALQQYEDPRFPNDLSKRWVRPGQASKQRVAIDLLRTCRAVYVETFCMPVASNTVHLYDGDSKDLPLSTPLHLPVYHVYAGLRMKPWQFAAVTKVDITLQQDKLEGGALERASRNIGAVNRHQGCRFDGAVLLEYPSVKWLNTATEQVPRTAVRMPTLRSSVSKDRFCVGLPVSHLTLRLNRTDWWTWTDHPDTSDPGKQLRLEPMINHTRPPNNNVMLKGNEARRGGSEPTFDLDDFEAQGRWGLQITEFWPDLQTLELVFETFEAKESQLDNVVSSAKLWTFPMQNGSVLQCTSDEELLRWQGASKYGYELSVPWLVERATDLPDAARKVARSFWRRLTRHNQDESKGQRFVVKTLTYERRKRATSSTDS